MEWAEIAWLWVGHEIAHFGVRWLVIGAFLMLGALIFGRDYKRRIKRLEDSKAGGVHIGKQFNFNEPVTLNLTFQDGAERRVENVTRVQPVTFEAVTGHPEVVIRPEAVDPGD